MPNMKYPDGSFGPVQGPLNGAESLPMSPHVERALRKELSVVQDDMSRWMESVREMCAQIERDKTNLGFREAELNKVRQKVCDISKALGLE